MKSNSKWNVTQSEISLKMECQSKLNVTQNGVSLKIECHYECYVTENGMSPKRECHSNWNVTQDWISLKFEYNSNLKAKYIEKDVIRRTSNSASLGRISILFSMIPLKRWVATENVLTAPLGNEVRSKLFM